MGAILAAHQRFKMHGRKYVIKRMYGAKRFDACPLEGEFEDITLTENDVSRLLARGELEFLLPDTSKVSKNSMDFNQLPEDVQKLAKYRYSYVVEALQHCRFKVSEKKLRKVIKSVTQKKKYKKAPSTRSVRRWLKKYVQAGRNIRVLVTDNRCKANGRFLDPQVEAFVKNSIENYYLQSKFETFEDVYDAIKEEIDSVNERLKRDKSKKLSYPCRDTIYRRLKNWNQIELIEGRFGKYAAERIYRTIGHKQKPTRIMEICEIDSTVLDVFVVTDDFLPIGRPTLTAMIDVYSRTICGFYLGFDPPGYMTTMYCMYHAFLDKDYVIKDHPEIKNQWDNKGLPEVLVIDNGPEFVNASMENVCKLIGTTLVYSPRREPWFKGTIERWFYTLDTGLLHSLPGATFSDKKSRFDRILLQSYNPEKDAVISFKNLNKLIHKFIIDVYHQRQHRGLKGLCPIQVWSEGLEKHSVAFPHSLADLNAILGSIETRTLTRTGIEFMGFHYNCDSLKPIRARLEGQKVTFTYHPADISTIYIHDNVHKVFVPVPATDQENTRGISKWEHEITIKYLKKKGREINSSTVSRGRREIKAFVKSKMTEAKVKSRAKGSRLTGTRFTHPSAAPKSLQSQPKHLRTTDVNTLPTVDEHLKYSNHNQQLDRADDNQQEDFAHVFQGAGHKATEGGPLSTVVLSDDSNQINGDDDNKEPHLNDSGIEEIKGGYGLPF